MDKFLLLGFVILLCFMNVSSGPHHNGFYPLRCNHCEPKNPCDSEINMCLAAPNQFCKTVKIYFSQNNYTTILTCSKRCKPQSSVSNGFRINIACCKDEDYCNVD
ncbi:prostate and testis expressed protein 3-like [Sminthopsis crassicaudata]|uniref:prostate and testis expressed protein 3-like n=1 Tax=Sminthopsis crassicaudata TaxID=9301 RepID=UPI003D68E871